MEALFGDLYRMDKRQVKSPSQTICHKDQTAELRDLYNCPQVFYQILNFGMIVSSALMIWKGLMVVTGSESPIVVVLR